MGLWNSHTSVGNILGSLIAGYWVSSNWGMSFIVPGLLIAAMGVVCFLFLIERECAFICDGCLQKSVVLTSEHLFPFTDPNDLKSMYAQRSAPGQSVSTELYSLGKWSNLQFSWKKM